MRNMHVWPYFVSDNIVWFGDSCAGGLYTYNCKSEEVCCKIKSDVLFGYGIFEIAALACWRSFVFIFSEKLSGKHIVYDSLRKTIKRIDGLKDENYVGIHQAMVIDQELYLIPSEMKGYVYAINLAVWCETEDSTKLENRKINIGATMRNWLPKSNGKALYLAEYQGKRIFCVENDKTKVINLDIPSVLCTVGVFGDELWAVPLYGRDVFCVTLEGNIKERVHLPLECRDEDKSDIWEIIVKEEFVFLLHWAKPEIEIYNRKSKKVIKINGKEFKRPCAGGVGDDQYYLPYVVENHSIRFLPSRCSMLEVSLPDLSYKQIEFDFPRQILDEELDEWRRTIRRYRYNREDFFYEREGGKLGTYMEFISDSSLLQKSINSQLGSIGGQIYQYILK